jgi:hypothetical protein
VELELAVKVIDAREAAIATSRCVEYRPHCARTVRFTPDWRNFKAAYMQHFGVVETPVEPKIS